MKSRLKKIALMAPDIFQKQIEQISDKGRDILKAIEDYKFFIEQVSRVVKNDPGLTQMIINKKKNLDQASQQIYDVVFDIENMDITTSYYDQQQATELSKGPNKQGPIPSNNIPPAGVPTPPVSGGSPQVPNRGLVPNSPNGPAKEDNSKSEDNVKPKDKADDEKGDSSKDE